MRRGAQPDHRPAAIEVGVEVLHLLLRKVLKPQEHHREVGRVERFHAGHVGVARHDLALSLSMLNSTVHLKP
jgi:hypothetical protein